MADWLQGLKLFIERGSQRVDKIMEVDLKNCARYAEDHLQHPKPTLTVCGNYLSNILDKDQTG